MQTLFTATSDYLDTRIYYLREDENGRYYLSYTDSGGAWLEETFADVESAEVYIETLKLKLFKQGFSIHE